MTFPVPVLDHVVINVASQLDDASALYRPAWVSSSQSAAIILSAPATI